GLSKIKRALRAGKFEFGLHFLEELASDELTLEEVVSSILTASEFDKLTDDPSNIRYRIFGISDSGRNIVTIVIYSEGKVFFKTVYEA
ncbi:MAG TPA: DUF4258 domain-containing protein, partial [Pyrinomonadaceae bacterium]